ncbi:CDGSH iron-sulfur domain-containing protein [Caldisphaera sp.]|uniref:CDGSH iron-sulfur domain-containing protein n=1 Tax=Caldisphaera sp. TaxID=2060322 RepID=UPI0026B9F555
MARIVMHERDHPYAIKLDNGKEIHICGCGLSKNKPYCDGTHKKHRMKNQEKYICMMNLTIE